MIYLSFIGNHDKLNPPSGFGAFSNICSVYNSQIRQAYVFVTNSSSVLNYVQIAAENINLLKGKWPHIDFQVVRIDLPNPIDYDVVYPKMLDTLTNLLDEMNLGDEEKLINITSGTPTMTSCWILLAQSGLIKNAKLVQSFESKFAGASGKTTREVDFNIDDFPKIEAPSALKRQLTIISRENKKLNDSLTVRYLDEEIPELVGKSKQIREIKEQILKDINYKTHVLILGERGTGKEVVAKAIWKRYHTATDTRLLTIDCGTLSTSLYASELFGYKKGAFTGAQNDSEGLIGANIGKTIFLDEIGNLPIDGQQQLLRVLSHGEYRRVGDTEVRNIHIHIIAATNKNVEDPTLFAQDIKDRFDEIVFLPALRDRREDIPLLLNYFVDTYSRTDSLPSPITLDSSLVTKLTEYDWPGNIRELEKWVQKITRRFSNGGLIRLHDLPDKFISGIINDNVADSCLPTLPLSISLQEYVDNIIDKARAMSGDNMSEVDRLLNQKIGTEKQRRFREKNRAGLENEKKL